MSEEREKPKMTKEELAKAWKEYYDWLQSIYTVESFEIQGKDEEKLYFYHGFNTKSVDNEKYLVYYLRDNEYAKYLDEQKCLHLQGEEVQDDREKEYQCKGFINVDKNEKWFNFGIESDYQGFGYGTVIYDNISQILEMLGIEDAKQYELRVYGNSNHDFFKRIATKKLVAKTDEEPNKEKALQILEEFSYYPNAMRFSELNAIIEYAINSNVSMEEIAKAINDNGFNIDYSTVNGIPHFQEEDFEKFKSFGIIGLKATCMHHHFMRVRNFGFMKLLDNVDIQDATLEFRKVFEEVKAEYERRKVEEGYIPHNLEKYGELEHLILDWKYLGLLLRNANPEIQELVKKQAISSFDKFDPEHQHPWGFQIDYESASTFAMLKDAGLMDKDTYIELYQKALNRNCNLEEFDSVVSRYIDSKERELAKEEISQNVYYPSPKVNWYKSRIHDKNHRIPKVEIPQKISKKGKVREILKQEILKQGIAKRTKIKTDMTGIDQDGKIFVVNNLKDWLFGVPGTHGNLQMMGSSAVAFPPQTPQFAIDLIKQVFNDLEHPDLGERE